MAGRGNVQELVRGKKYRLSWDLGPRDATGYRPRKTETFYGTRREAEARWLAVAADLQAGQPVRGRPRTVGDLARAWLAQVVAVRNLPSTAARYESLVTHYILPAWQNLPLTRWDPETVQRAFAAWAQSGVRGRPLSRAALANLRIVCSAMAKAGVGWGWLSRNPAAGVVIGGAPPREHTVWTPDQAARFLVAAHPHWRLLWTVLLMTGIREGEAISLRWDDWDEAAHTLTIRRGAYTHLGLDAEGPGKSAAARRRIPLVPSAQAALTQQRRWWEAQRDLFGGAWRSDRVWVTAWGRPLRPSTLRYALQADCARAGVPVLTVHELRHTWASWQAAAGVPLSTIAVLMGHADPALTMRVYLHADQAAMAEWLRRALAPLEGAR